MDEPFFILTLAGGWTARVRKSRTEGFPSLDIAILFYSESQRTEFITDCMSDGYDAVKALRESSEA